MRNWLYWTHEAINEDELRQFVVENGGYWNDEPTLRQGVIERGAGRVFVSKLDLEREGLTEAPLEVTAALGGAPEAAVDIHIGHDMESVALAEAVVRSLSRRWHGVVDAS